jgi:polysaccharide export outer membrane protein
MSSILSRKILPFLLLWLLAACNPTRNLVYFSNLKENDRYQTPPEAPLELRLQPNDLVSIRVSSLNPESNALFNRGVLAAPGAVATTLSAENTPTEGYLLDQSGDIDFPVLGKVKLGGLTNTEATTKMTTQIQQYVKSPIVTIRLLNFKVTVIGEVNRPSTFLVPTQRITILEALGLAGDMTAYGRRENVLLVREQNQVRSTTRLNLNDKALLTSPYFYLQQNDVIYVAPDKIKQVQASTNTLKLTLAGLGITIISALIFNYQNIFK